MEITHPTGAIDEASGYEHGVMDATQVGIVPMHLSDFNPRAWDNASPAYQLGYEAGWADGQPSINE